jgi:putative ABC transport system permease protein
MRDYWGIVTNFLGDIRVALRQLRQAPGFSAAARMALAETRQSILWLVLRRALILMAAGLSIGAVAAFTMKSLIASFLYGVGGTDVVSYLSALAGLLGIGIAASLLPARRAATSEPMDALRAD